MLKFPPADHIAAGAYAPEDLQAIASGQFFPPDLQQAKRLAREAFGRYHGARIMPKALIYLVLRADDQIDLISVGPRGGWKVLWSFGQYSEFRIPLQNAESFAM